MDNDPDTIEVHFSQSKAVPGEWGGAARTGWKGRRDAVLHTVIQEPRLAERHQLQHVVLNVTWESTPSR